MPNSKHYKSSSVEELFLYEVDFNTRRIRALQLLFGQHVNDTKACNGTSDGVLRLGNAEKESWAIPIIYLNNKLGSIYLPY